LNYAKGNLTKVEVNEMILATDIDGRAAFHVAGMVSKTELFQGLLIWAKKNLTKDELNKLFLSTINEGGMVSHTAAVVSKVEGFQRILILVK
jgi:hypothetical protein